MFKAIEDRKLTRLQKNPKMNEEELLEKRSELKSKILILDWDKKMSQLNFGKNQHLEEYKKELEKIESELIKINPPEIP